MQVTIKTPFGEMSFNMTQDKANDLMKKALDYATGQEDYHRQEITQHRSGLNQGGHRINCSG